MHVCLYPTSNAWPRPSEHCEHELLCILGVSHQIWNCALFSIKRSFLFSKDQCEHIDVLECCNTRFKDLLHFINSFAGNCMKMACGCCRSRNILMFILVLQMVSVKILRYFAHLSRHFAIH